MDRFELEGVTYYQQGRKCGKAACKCANGHLHGPYWYCSDQGRVGYIGKALPEPISRARAAHDGLLTDMVRQRRQFITKADVLTRLIGHAPLSQDDRAMLVALGYGDCLVSPASWAATQD